MNEQVAKQGATSGAEWYAAWLMKAEVKVTEAIQTEQVTSNVIEQIRAELKAVTDHLIDPGTQGIRASLPHLEKAVTAFGKYIKMKALPSVEPALESLRAELALATMLFENAYTLQAGWAAERGLNLDGTLKQLLYSRSGEPAGPSPGIVTNEIWQG